MEKLAASLFSTIAAKFIKHGQKATLEMADIQDIIAVAKPSNVKKILDGISDLCRGLSTNTSYTITFNFISHYKF
jgi:hypothetical protein